MLDAFAPADDVVLAGHSLGGLTIPIVVAARPVQAMGFVADALAQLAE